MGLLTNKKNRTLEDLLEDLERYGDPKVRRATMLTSSGWIAVIEMRTSVEGTEFEVKSEHRHPTARAAVEQLYDRVQAALNFPNGT